MTGLLSPPPETLINVFGYVEPKDLKTLRTTCKRFENAATPGFGEKFLVDRRHVITLESIKVLEEIVTHKYFGHFVQSIAFNCVRSIPPDALNEEDISSPVPPLQVNPEEGIEQSHAKLKMFCNIVKTIHANHGKISLGVFLENFYDEQLCHGLVDGLKYCTIDWSTGYRPSHSMMYLRNTLRALLKTCHKMRCPVQRVEVDLGRHSELFRRMVMYWHPDVEISTTLSTDIEEALPGQTTADLSLEIKNGDPDSRSCTFAYDHVKKSIRVYNEPSVPLWSQFPPMRYLMMYPGMNEWFNDPRIETLEIASSGKHFYRTFFVDHGYLAPCRHSLKHLNLQNINVARIRFWNSVVAFVSHLPVLKTCKLCDLASVAFSADRLQAARFLNILHFEAEGCQLKNKLQDLTARLQVYEVAWRSEAVDSPSKWLDDLGAKVDSRIQDDEEVASTAEAYHGDNPDIVPLTTTHESSSIGQLESLSDGIAETPEEVNVSVASLGALGNSTTSEQPPARSNSPEGQELMRTTTATPIVPQHTRVQANKLENALGDASDRPKQDSLDFPIHEKHVEGRSTKLTEDLKKIVSIENESSGCSSTEETSLTQVVMQNAGYA